MPLSRIVRLFLYIIIFIVLVLTIFVIAEEFYQPLYLIPYATLFRFFIGFGVIILVLSSFIVVLTGCLYLILSAGDKMVVKKARKLIFLGVILISGVIIYIVILNFILSLIGTGSNFAVPPFPGGLPVITSSPTR